MSGELVPGPSELVANVDSTALIAAAAAVDMFSVTAITVVTLVLLLLVTVLIENSRTPVSYQAPNPCLPNRPHPPT